MSALKKNIVANLDMFGKVRSIFKVLSVFLKKKTPFIPTQLLRDFVFQGVSLQRFKIDLLLFFNNLIN